MLSMYLDKDLAILGEQTPTVFLQDSDFMRMITDAHFRDCVSKYFDEPVCIGRLGVLYGDVYEERPTPVSAEFSGKGDMGYYAKV